VKRKTDPRHQDRINTVKVLFEKEFRQENYKLEASSIPAQILKKRKVIDDIIVKNAPAWPIAQIAPMDLAILRLAIWELLYKKSREPYKAIIDEAVEISKQYGSQSTGSFVNGVLGSLVKTQPKIVN